MGGSVGGSSHPQWQSWLAVPGNVCVSIVPGIFSLFICISLSALGASYLNVGNHPLKLTVRKKLNLPSPKACSNLPSPKACSSQLSLTWNDHSEHVGMTGNECALCYGCSYPCQIAFSVSESQGTVPLCLTQQAHTGISRFLLYHGLNFMSCDTLNWCHNDYTCLSSWFSSS